VFEEEIQDFPGFYEEKQKFYGESAQNCICLLHLTTPRTPSFSQCRPAPPGQFHQISIDNFTLLVDVASFGFRPMIIETAAIVSGCHPRLK
jgi:hypothetical protein